MNPLIIDGCLQGGTEAGRLLEERDEARIKAHEARMAADGRRLRSNGKTLGQLERWAEEAGRAAAAAEEEAKRARSAATAAESASAAAVQARTVAGRVAELAVSLRFLARFAAQHVKGDITTGDLVETVIKPATAAKKCRYVDLDGVSPADVWSPSRDGEAASRKRFFFISHAFGCAAVSSELLGPDPAALMLHPDDSVMFSSAPPQQPVPARPQPALLDRFCDDDDVRGIFVWLDIFGEVFWPGARRFFPWRCFFKGKPSASLFDSVKAPTLPSAVLPRLLRQSAATAINQHDPGERVARAGGLLWMLSGRGELRRPCATAVVMHLPQASSADEPPSLLRAGADLDKGRTLGRTIKLSQQTLVVLDRQGVPLQARTGAIVGRPQWAVVGRQNNCCGRSPPLITHMTRCFFQANPATDDAPLTFRMQRLWCLYEMAVTPTERLQLLTFGLDLKGLGEIFRAVDVEKARCFSNIDEKTIHDLIIHEHGSLRTLTGKLKVMLVELIAGGIANATAAVRRPALFASCSWPSSGVGGRRRWKHACSPSLQPHRCACVAPDRRCCIVLNRTLCCCCHC